MNTSLLRMLIRRLPCDHGQTMRVGTWMFRFSPVGQIVPRIWRYQGEIVVTMDEQAIPPEHVRRVYSLRRDRVAVRVALLAMLRETYRTLERDSVRRGQIREVA